MLYCPKCGTPISATDTFCGNCGQKLTPQATTNQETSTSQSEPTPTAPTTTKPARRTGHHTGNGKRKWLIAVLVVIVILGGLYAWGNSNYSKQKQVNNMITTLQKRDQTGAVKFLTTTDPSLSINAKGLAPFMTYLDQDKQYLANMKNDLLTTDQTSDGTFKLVKDGHEALIFPKYKLETIAMYPTVTTNIDQATISLNGLNVATANNTNYSYKAGPLFPGRYTFKLGGSADNSKSVTKNLVSAQAKSIKIDLSTPNDDSDSDTPVTATQATNSSSASASSSSESSDVDNSDSGDNNHGLFEEEYSGDEQYGIDEIADDYGFDYDDYTYIVSWPHQDVLQVKAYDKDTHQYDETYRYDQIHDISSSLDESTGKFEE
ncbi:TcaA second domain-containing protein [Secundilactobacillus muriivasis]